MIFRKINLTTDHRKNWPQLDTRERNPLGSILEIKPVKSAHKVIVPETSPGLSVSDHVQTHRLLEFHQALNSLILGRS
jgi:hypothetical protein